MTRATEAPVYEHAVEVPEEARRALRDLILVLADCKRLLGIRYADFILSAPTLESGIAAASMAQDEWGHSRLSYALLAEFGDDPKALEHDRAAEEYRSSELMDEPVESWVDVIALGVAFDTALAIQYSALLESRFTPLRNRVQKMIEEEKFHFHHAASWTRRLARSGSARAQLVDALNRFLPASLRWFGREDEEDNRLLAEHRLATGSPDAHRARYLATLGPLLRELELAKSVEIAEEPGGFRFLGTLQWEGWNAESRRSSGGGPDEDTLSRVRGDRNRPFLMD